MREASETVVGEKLDLSGNYLGLDELPEERKADGMVIRRLEKTEGYLERQRWFEEQQRTKEV